MMHFLRIAIAALLVNSAVASLTYVPLDCDAPIMKLALNLSCNASTTTYLAGIENGTGLNAVTVYAKASWPPSAADGFHQWGIVRDVSNALPLYLVFESEGAMAYSIVYACREPASVILFAVLYIILFVTIPICWFFGFIYHCCYPRTNAALTGEQLALMLSGAIDPTVGFWQGFFVVWKHSTLEASLAFAPHPQHPFSRCLRLTCWFSAFSVSFVIAHGLIGSDSNTWPYRLLGAVCVLLWSWALTFLATCAWAHRCQHAQAHRLKNACTSLGACIVTPLALLTYILLAVSLAELNYVTADPAAVIGSWLLLYVQEVFLSLGATVVLYTIRYRRAGSHHGRDLQGSELSDDSAKLTVPYEGGTTSIHPPAV
jgi:hypothetical protein